MFPTVQPYSVLPVQTVGGRSRSDHHHSLLAESALVPVSDGPHNRLPSSAPSVSRPPDFTYGRESPSGPEQFDPVNRMETLRRGLQTQGLSDEAIDLVLSATRKNTRAAYQSAWNSCRDWCSSKHKDPLSAGVSHVLNFLADVHNSGKSYRTINVARTMLSSTSNLKPSNLLSVGRDPRVLNLLKGVYNISPPVPKYVNTWDPDIVLAHLDAHANANLSLLELSRKAVTLLALCSLLKTSEIASILLESIRICDTKISFTLGKPRKAQHSGPLQQQSIDSWPQNYSICPVRCIELYLERSASLRNTSNSASVFLSSNKPHHTCSVATIGRWIKDQLKDAGIDTSTFAAHSTRSAAASKAAGAGIPVQAILDHEHWSKESTFARYYHRETISGPSNPISNSILRLPSTSSLE